MTTMNRRVAVRAAGLATAATVITATSAEAAKRRVVSSDAVRRPGGSQKIAPVTAVAAHGKTAVRLGEPSLLP